MSGCPGDSGSPVVAYRAADAPAYLVAVLSGGVGGKRGQKYSCGKKETSFMLSPRVWNHLDWIRKTTKLTVCDESLVGVPGVRFHSASLREFSGRPEPAPKAGVEGFTCTVRATDNLNLTQSVECVGGVTKTSFHIACEHVYLPSACVCGRERTSCDVVKGELRPGGDKCSEDTDTFLVNAYGIRYKYLGQTIERSVNNWDKKLSFEVGQHAGAISGWCSEYHRIHKDRMFTMNATRIYIGNAARFKTDTYATDFKKDFVLCCYLIRGAESVHDNEYEDRKWTFRYWSQDTLAQAGFELVEKTPSWQGQTKVGEPHNFKCPEGEVLAGIRGQNFTIIKNVFWPSVYDRQWEFHCSTLWCRGGLYLQPAASSQTASRQPPAAKWCCSAQPFEAACLEVCPESHYKNERLRACKPCKAGCKLCRDSISCDDKCPKGTYPVFDGKREPRTKCETCADHHQSACENQRECVFVPSQSQCETLTDQVNYASSG